MIMAAKRKKKSSGGKRTTKRPGGGPSLNDLFRGVLKDADELLGVDDPMEAEEWASSLLGVFYKPDVPFELAEQIERLLAPTLVQAAERRRDAAGLAALYALAAVLGDDDAGARMTAARMASRGVARPRWADVIGKPECVKVVAVTDVFDDQTSYHFTFAYPGRTPHVVLALYDENLGGIIKDILAGTPPDDSDPLVQFSGEPGIVVREIDPGEAAARVLDALSVGDLYIDNQWSDDFRYGRALLLSRMLRLLPEDEDTLLGDELDDEFAEPLDDDARDALVEEFLASPFSPGVPQATSIVDHCLVARCDFGDGDPLRWSPTVIELFMLDYLPRKITLSADEIDVLPEVLTAWVRFALTKRGLEEQFIEEAAQAVDDFAGEFREAMDDEGNFGPAKSIFRALKADGVDVLDQDAVDAWLKDFNSRPEEDRREFFGPLSRDD